MFVFSLDFPFFKKSVFFLRFEIQPTPLHKTEQNDSQEYLGHYFLYRNCFSFCFLVPPIIRFFFGSGSFYRLLRLPKT